METDQNKFEIILEHLKSNHEVLKLLWQKIDILEKELYKRMNFGEKKKAGLSDDKKEKRKERWNRMIEKAREKYPNAWKSWSEPQDEELMNLHKEGKSLEEISDKMGRHPNSIRARLENKHGITEGDLPR